MTILKRHVLRIRYEGGTAEEQTLPLYDGTASIHGIAQALQITTHAYVNNQIVSRATAARGAQFLLRPAKQGSFLVEIITLIEQYPAVAAISAPFFYDFVKLVFNKATGLIDARPETTNIERILERDEPFFDDLAVTLEGSLQRSHRPIGQGVDTVKIERPRSTLLTFDAGTQNWVNTRDEAPAEEVVTGNVTRFNSVTHNGRIFIDQLRRIVPFRLTSEFLANELGLLTWSLHGSNTDLPKKLELVLKHVKSAHGETKRVIISSCSRIE